LGKYGFDQHQFTPVDSELRYGSKLDQTELSAAVEQFLPDAIVCLSWRFAPFRAIMRTWKQRALRLACFDSQWVGSSKQQVGRLVAPIYMHPLYDMAFVAGPRQIVFARKLGFSPQNIIEGFAVCDWDRFAKVYRQRTNSRDDSSNAFLFVGRLAPVKGIEVLLAAYRIYRSSSAQPWPLIVSGIGPNQRLLSGEPGVEYIGFTQSAEVPGLMGRASCLVLPSVFEPWGSCCMKLRRPVWESYVRRSAARATPFVSPGENGYVVEPGDVQGLAAAMTRFAQISPDQLQRCRQVSFERSQYLTPALFSQRLIEAATRHAAQRAPSMAAT